MADNISPTLEENNVEIPEVINTATPEPIVADPVVEEPVVTPIEDVTVDAPVIEEPVLEPVVDTPEVFGPQEATEPKAPFISDFQSNLMNGKITVPEAQATKAEQLAIEEQENLLKAQEQTKAQAEFKTAVDSGASFEELVKMSSANPELKDNFNSILRQKYTNNQNIQYVAKYSGMSNEAMTDAVNNSEVVIGSDKYKLLSPEQRASFEQYYKEATANNTKEDDNKKFESDQNNIISNSSQEETIAGFVGLNVRTASKNLFNSPEITSSSTKLTSKKNEINDLTDIIDGIKDDVTKEYPTLSSSAKAAVIADRTAKLNKSKNTLINEYNSELGNYTRLKDNATQELELLKYEDAQASAAYKAKLDAYESIKTSQIEAKTAADKIKADLIKTEFEAENKVIAADTQFQRDIALLEFKAKLADDGMNGEYVERDDGTYFLYNDETIPAKKILDAVITPGLTSNTVFEDGVAYTEIYDINNNGVGFTSQNTSLSAKSRELLNAPDDTRIPTRLNKEDLSPNNPGGKECGEYVNDIMAETVGKKIGSFWQDKLNYANESTGEIGSVAVWKVNPNIEDKYGHTGVIVGETETDGVDEWIIKSSNVNGAGIVTRVRVPKEAIDGYKTTGVIGRQKSYNTAQEEFLKTIDITGGTNKEAKASIANMGLTEADVYSFKATNLPKEKTTQFNDILAKINNLKGDDGKFTSARGFSGAVGFGFGESIIPGTRSRDFVSDFNSFKSLLTVENLDKMSGVLTDKDLEILKSAALSIELGNSEKQFAKRLKEVENVYKKALGQEVIDPKDVIYTDRQEGSSTIGKEFSKETLKAELLRQIKENGRTPEEINIWLKENNLSIK